MTCFERLDTADANKRILEYRKKEEQEFPEEQFIDPATDCEFTDSMGYVIYLEKNDDGYLKKRWREDSLFGEYRYSPNKPPFLYLVLRYPLSFLHRYTTYPIESV